MDHTTNYGLLKFVIVWCSYILGTILDSSQTSVGLIVQLIHDILQNTAWIIAILVGIKTLSEWELVKSYLKKRRDKSKNKDTN